MNNENNNIGNQIPNNNQNTYQQTQPQTMNQSVQNIPNKRKMNRNALISIILSAVSLFIFGWLGAIGMGLGIRSLSEIKKNNEAGKVLAIIGIITGCIGLGLYIYILIDGKFY